MGVWNWSNSILRIPVFNMFEPKESEQKCKVSFSHDLRRESQTSKVDAKIWLFENVLDEFMTIPQCLYQSG